MEIRVVADELNAHAASIRALVAAFEQASGAMESLDRSLPGAAGAPELSDALHQFLDAVGSSVYDLASRDADLADALSRAADAYTANDASAMRHS